MATVETPCRETLSINGDDDGDLDSLFGGDDDTELTSLLNLGEVGAVEPECEPVLSLPQDCSPPQAADAAALLSFPSEHAQAGPNCQHRGAVPTLALPAVPDPPGAPLFLHQDGHTSGDAVVSTQVSAFEICDPLPHQATTAPPAPAPVPALDDAALEAELRGLWESIATEEQPVNAHAGSQDSSAPPEEDVILATQIPGFRYAHSQTNSWVRLPRRVDLHQHLAEDLIYFITLNRGTKIEVLYDYLELGLGDGKILSGQIRKLLKEPPLRQLVEQGSSGGGVLETKRILVRAAFYMLIQLGMGATWFGPECRTAQTRTLFWPRDSSVLMAGFIMLLYRAFCSRRQALRLQARNQQGGGQLSPSPSVPLSSPAGSPPSAPMQAPERRPSFFEALAKDAVAAKKRKHAESALGTGESNLHPSYELEIPANARLKYHVYLKDRTDGADLAPPTKYRHTDHAIAHGAFSSLRSAFEVAAAAEPPLIHIQTPHGVKNIASEQDWEAAVVAIYNARRLGGVVEVTVYV